MKVRAKNLIYKLYVILPYASSALWVVCSCIRTKKLAQLQNSPETIFLKSEFFNIPKMFSLVRLIWMKNFKFYRAMNCSTTKVLKKSILRKSIFCLFKSFCSVNILREGNKNKCSKYFQWLIFIFSAKTPKNWSVLWQMNLALPTVIIIFTLFENLYGWQQC